MSTRTPIIDRIADKAYRGNTPQSLSADDYMALLHEIASLPVGVEARLTSELGSNGTQRVHLFIELDEKWKRLLVEPKLESVNANSLRQAGALALTKFLGEEGRSSHTRLIIAKEILRRESGEELEQLG